MKFVTMGTAVSLMGLNMRAGVPVSAAAERSSSGDYVGQPGAGGVAAAQRFRWGGLGCTGPQDGAKPAVSYTGESVPHDSDDSGKERAL